MNRLFPKLFVFRIQIIVFLFISIKQNTCLAQNVISKVYYEFEHVDDRNQPENPHREDLVVYLTQEATIQKNVTTLAIREAVNDFIFNPNRQVNSNGAAVLNLPIIQKDISKYEYYHNFKNRQSFLFSHLFDTYYVIEDAFPDLAWELLDGTKKIGGFDCQLAKSNFGGRLYYAWFTTEIPYPYGPWKLLGLPGLILEAYDDNNEVSWKFNKFELVDSQNEERIISPKDGIITTKEKFEKTFNSVKKNPIAARKAAVSSAKASGSFGLKLDNSIITEYAVGHQKIEGFKEKVLNNPIEIGK